jgi:Kef-type K+ transport system membrane component KefB
MRDCHFRGARRWKTPISPMNTLPLGHLFLQIAVILITCKICSFIMRRVGQPSVIGEMIAGVFLGPSLLGLLAPDISAWLFPPASKPVLNEIAQMGLTLYMFTVGLEFRTDLLSQRARSAFAVSFAGMAAPFVLGALLSLPLHQTGGFYGDGISPAMAAVFTGAAMCVTAFPMLARIIRERGLAGTTAGTLALASGSLDDVAAWILLAGVIGAVQGDALLVVWTLLGAGAYLLVCRTVAPLLFKKGDDSSQRLFERFGLLLICLALGAWFTDQIRLFAVFGAFFLGVFVPRGKLTDYAIDKITPLTTLFLLPLFFTYSGLNTQIQLLNSPTDWLFTGLIILAAVAGKMGACYGAARICRENHADSLTIASLMNARGLMELIMLNIGLQAGIISPSLFSAMVVMAIVTTLMAAPFFELARRRAARSHQV